MLKDYKWYRKLRGGVWFKHRFNEDALQICVTFTGNFWARYANINRYTDVIDVEYYAKH